MSNIKAYNIVRNKIQHRSISMDERAKKLLLDFIQEKLNGNIDNIRDFDFKTLRESDKFGCPRRYFDCDDTEVMRAVYVVLWENFLPELSMDTLGNTGKYRGDTMNSFHTMFGREIPEKPGFYAGLEKYNPTDEIRERVRKFSRKYCSTIGNFVVLPNLYVQNTTLNFYRGTNQWRDFFDRFLIQLRNVLCDYQKKDPLLNELVAANSFCFDQYRGRKGFLALEKILLLEDYCEYGNTPKIEFPMNYHWKNPADAETYLKDVEAYLDRAECIIYNRSWNIWFILREKLADELKNYETGPDSEESTEDEVCLPQPEDNENGTVHLVWKEGERTWVKNHWEYADGCTPLDKCFEITPDFDKALDMLSKWTDENGGPVGVICTDNIYEEYYEAERDACRTISYAERFLIKEGFLSPENAITVDPEDQN